MRTGLPEAEPKCPGAVDRPPIEASRAPRSFVLATPYSGVNLGDGAIQESVIAAIRQRWPNALIRGVNLAPIDTRALHGIETFSLVVSHTPASDPESTSPALAVHTERVVAGVARRLLPRGWPWKIKSALRRIAREPAHWVRAYRYLRGTDQLIFSGGGQIDDNWGGAWEHPFAIWKWCLLARLRGIRPAFLSVGVESLETAVGRVLTRWALSLASYRSYRDTGSRELMATLGCGWGDPIYPDLAFGFPAARIPTPPGGVRRGVGLCPVAYYCPGRWCREDAAVYQRYLDHLCAVAGWLLGQGHEVVLFCSDTGDHPVLDEFAALLRSRLGAEELRRLRIHRVHNVDEYLEIAASVECLVASRLHSIILGQLAGTPAIALSLGRKVDVHMESVGQGRFRLPIDGFELPQFVEHFEALQTSLESERERLREHFAGFRHAVEAQYDALLAAD